MHTARPKGEDSRVLLASAGGTSEYYARVFDALPQSLPGMRWEKVQGALVERIVAADRVDPAVRDAIANARQELENAATKLLGDVGASPRVCEVESTDALRSFRVSFDAINDAELLHARVQALSDVVTNLRLKVGVSYLGVEFEAR